MRLLLSQGPKSTLYLNAHGAGTRIALEVVEEVPKGSRLVVWVFV